MPDIQTPHTLNPPKTIALVGLMGAGKSHIGRRLSQIINLPFKDSDSEVENAAGRRISDIFEELGETAFREGERKIINRLIDGPPIILATGGGAFINPVTQAALLDHAICIWLRADLDLLVHRTEGRNTRPLLMTGNPRAILSDLIEKRYPIYEKAHIIVDTHDEPSDITTNRVIAAIRAYLPTLNTRP